MNEITEIEVAIYENGYADENELNSRIAQTWERLLAEGDGAIPGFSDLIVAHSLQPIFKAKARNSGFSGAEVAIIFLTAAAAKMGEEIGSAAAEAIIERVKELWNRHFGNTISTPTDRTLGDKK